MKNATRIKLAASLILAAIAAPSLADTEGSQLTVTTQIQNTCAIGDGLLDFGPNSIAVSSDGTAGTTFNADQHSGSSISIICTNGAAAAITADAGANAVGAVRNMLNGTGDLLQYELYTDGTRNTVLNGANSITYTGTGAATTNTIIYGRIAAADLQTAKNGIYSDTVGLTITYAP